MTAEEIKKACDSINEKLARNRNNDTAIKLLNKQAKLVEKMEKLRKINNEH